jgi:hypothetical protein
MQVLYRKSDLAVVDVSASFGGVAEGFGVLEADVENWEGKTLADISGAEGLLKADIRSRIDSRTAADILAGFDHQGVRFKLTAEDQLNFSNLYVARELLPYPVTVKGRAWSSWSFQTRRRSRPSTWPG